MDKQQPKYSVGDRVILRKYPGYAWKVVEVRAVRKHISYVVVATDDDYPAGSYAQQYPREMDILGRAP